MHVAVMLLRAETSLSGSMSGIGSRTGCSRYQNAWCCRARAAGVKDTDSPCVIPHGFSGILPNDDHGGLEDRPPLSFSDGPENGIRIHDFVLRRRRGDTKIPLPFKAF